jgi:hypothetical protein
MAGFPTGTPLFFVFQNAAGAAACNSMFKFLSQDPDRTMKKYGDISQLEATKQ